MLFAGFFLTIKTESCHKTDAANFLSVCGNWKGRKNQQKGKYICFVKMLYISTLIAHDYKRWSF